jgi:serine/threonine protein kinase
MAIQPGTHVGPYEILSAIGAGGMGEVYRAHDPKLCRDLAIKVLPEAFARDADRMARFQREAKVLASLDHPNIATIHGLEETGSTRALVMQLVEGPTLADRIKAGPIPVDEAVRIARQIADALEYAHERGIIHRDLKPANVKVTTDDSVKVLDFGLAKALEGDPSSIDISTSPTISRMATMQGVLLGTAAYMSPEQAKAKSVDRRADIWAFGCVLYEMLTGRQAFTGETVTDTLASVIKEEPAWKLLPATTPMRVRVLLQRCLQKDPKQRLRDIGDARISLDEVLSGTPDVVLAGAAAASAHLWWRPLPWAVAAFLSTVIALALAFVHLREKPGAPAQLLRYEIFPPEKTSFGPDFAVSPDGRHLAFTATGQDGQTQLWVRDLDSLVSRPLPGTEGATRPFWSSDSRSLAFQDGSRLETLEISGGPPQTICSVVGIAAGAWNRDGVIVFGGLQGLKRVSATGGTPALLTKVDASRGEVQHISPSFLPDGRHFLYVRVVPGANGTYLGSLDVSPELADSRPLVAGRAVYAPPLPSEPGRILFLQPNGTLMAQVFDASRAELEGDPTPIAEGVSSLTVSANGVVAYAGENGTLVQLTWFDRQGKALGTVGEPGVVQPRPAISPDGHAVVVARTDLTLGGTDLWVYDLARDTRSRLTFDGKAAGYPVWSPDGSHIAFLSASGKGAPDIYEKAVNGVGQEEAVEKAPAAFRVPADWSHDGRYLIEGVVGSTASIWVLPLDAQQGGGDRKSAPYLTEGSPSINPKLSPNGQWMAYSSEETGRSEIYVQTFPKLGGKWTISINGGTRPVWSRDGRELYFIGLDGNLMAVEVKSGPGGSFEAGEPKALFDPHIAGNDVSGFDVAKDGRFLIPKIVGQSGGGPIKVVVNWTAGLEK